MGVLFPVVSMENRWILHTKAAPETLCSAQKSVWWAKFHPVTNRGWVDIQSPKIMMLNTKTDTSVYGS
jgi:hypothetical protein